MIGAVARVRRRWPGAGIWLPLPFVAWTLGCLVTGHGRVEHVVLLVGVPILAYASDVSKRVFLGLLPMGILGLVYDAMRWVKDVGLSEARVHVCDLRAIDMSIASAEVGDARGSVHDWLQEHPSQALDLVCAVPYGTFLFVAFGFAIFLYWRSYPRMVAFAWSFLIVNLAGFVTYHLYPAAPPWYFHTHGCTVDLAARASEGANLARVDALLGVSYFRDVYGRSSDVFGAVPSLHVSYPMLMVLFGWPVLGLSGRLATIVFLGSMCVAAVALDHHWIVDVALGLVYALAVYGVVTVVAASRRAPLAERAAFVIATWFGCGRVPIAPGTAGTLGAIPLYLLVRAHGPAAVLVCAAVVAAIGVWAAGRVVDATGEHDPQIVVVDEVAGVLVTLAACAPTWTNVIVGVVLFRIFDQLKPWPARALEALPRGWGVVLDDIAAGVVGALVIVALRIAGLP